MSNVPTLKKLIAGKVSLKDTLDYVEAKVVEQGHPALNAAGHCVYLTNDGSKCAVGHLLSAEDHAYLSRGMGGNVYSVLSSNAEYFDVNDRTFGMKRTLGVPEDIRLTKLLDVLTEVQNAHDSLNIRDNFVESFKERMRTIRNVHPTAINTL